MKHALEYTKDIVVARMNSSTHRLDAEFAQDVAEYFEIIYNKISELEDNSKSNATL